jgi:hypothetical protein
MPQRKWGSAGWGMSIVPGGRGWEHSPPPAPGGGGGGIVTDNLALHLDAKDASSYPGTGTKWTDLVAATEFTFSSAPAYNSDTGFFNFTGNHATGTTSINPTRGAVEIWFRWRTTSSISVGIMLTGAVNWAALGNLTGTLPDESLEFYTGISACMDYRKGHTYLKDGEWHQMVAVIDGADNKLYMDGLEIVNPPDPPGSPTYFRTGNAASTGLMNLANVVIGKYSSGYQFDGDISIIRVYDTGTDSFSAADVAQNYAANSGRFSGSFDPGQLSSLTLWFDASDASTLTLSGSDVDQMQDKALYVADGKLVPTASNSNPASIVNDGGINWMAFDGSNSEWMQAKSGSSLLAFNTLMDGSSWEMHVVAKVISAPDATAPPNGAQIIGDSGGWIGINTRTGLSGGKVRVGPWSYNNNDGETEVDASTGHVYGSSMLAGSGVTNYYTDGNVTARSGGNNPGGSTVQLGRAYNSLFSTVQVGEVVIFDSPLTASQRSDLMSYFQTKWGTP